jgi:hypothetical protein
MFGQAVKTGKRAGCTLARMEDVAVRQLRSAREFYFVEFFFKSGRLGKD